MPYNELKPRLGETMSETVNTVNETTKSKFLASPRKVKIAIITAAATTVAVVSAVLIVKYGSTELAAEVLEEA